LLCGRRFSLHLAGTFRVVAPRGIVLGALNVPTFGVEGVGALAP
jgi:hypothetical protein